MNWRKSDIVVYADQENTRQRLMGSMEKSYVVTQCSLIYRKTKIGQYPTEFLGGQKHFDSQIETKQAIQIRDFLTCFPIIQKILPSFQGKKLLEIGSYYGHLLDYARKLGFITTGLDPDPKLAEIARRKFGLEIIDKFLRDAAFPDERFDVVVMFHVIEHFNDPLLELKEINRILKKGGMLVIETPRYDTLWFKILREHERSVIPEHFTFFSKFSLKQMLEKAGFEIIRIDTVGRTLTLDRLCTNVSKIIGSKYLAIIIMSLVEKLRLERFSFHMNMGDMMRAYVRKPS